MKLNQFRYLVAISEHGSIAKTARALYTSQPAISQSMKELEEELGFPVLVRDRIGTTFTLQGEQVLEIAQNILRELNKLDKLTGTESGNLWGNLTIGGTPYFSDSLLLNMIIDFRQKHPDLTIRLEEGSSQAVLNMLRDGVINLGLILYCNLDAVFFKSKLKEYSLWFHPLFEDEMVFVASREHPLAQQGAATMKEILSYPVIQYKSDINDLTLQMFRQYRSDLDLLYIDDFNSLWRLPVIGPYLFISPLHAIQTHDHGLLSPIHIKDMDYHCTIGWVHNEQPLLDAEEAVVASLQTLSGQFIE